MSSTNWSPLIPLNISLKPIPSINPIESALLSKVESTLVTRMNNACEQGSLYLSHCLNFIQLSGFLLIRIATKDEDKRFVIQPIQVCENPLAYIISNKKFWLMLSKVVSKSNLQSIPLWPDLRQYANTSWALRKFLTIDLSLIKADCATLIKIGRYLASPSANILLVTLYRLLRRLIGLKSQVVSTPSFLDISKIDA